MKRVDLVRHLETHGCEFLREGGRHTIYVNRAAQWIILAGRIIGRFWLELSELKRGNKNGSGQP